MDLNSRKREYKKKQCFSNYVRVIFANIVRPRWTACSVSTWMPDFFLRALLLSTLPVWIDKMKSGAGSRYASISCPTTKGLNPTARWMNWNDKEFEHFVQKNTKTTEQLHCCRDGIGSSFWKFKPNRNRNRRKFVDG
jgi:hypothetical protein